MCNTFSDIGDISKHYRSVKRVPKYFYFRIKKKKRIKKDTYGFHLLSKEIRNSKYKQKKQFCIKHFVKLFQQYSAMYFQTKCHYFPSNSAIKTFNNYEGISSKSKSIQTSEDISLFRNIQRKTPVLEFLFNKVAGIQLCNFIKKILHHKCLPVNTANTLNNIYERQLLNVFLLENKHHFLRQYTI